MKSYVILHQHTPKYSICWWVKLMFCIHDPSQQRHSLFVFLQVIPPVRMLMLCVMYVDLGSSRVLGDQNASPCMLPASLAACCTLLGQKGDEFGLNILGSELHQ